MDKIKLFREVCSEINRKFADFSEASISVGWRLVEEYLLSLNSAPSSITASYAEYSLLDFCMDILDESFVDCSSEILDKMADTYEKKNHDYGDSFGKSVRKYGFISCVTRLSDKYNRYKSLQTREAKVNDEKMEDTLLDMLCYSVMTIVEIRSIYNEE